MTCDARRIVDASPVLARLQMLGMQRVEAAVSTWVAEHWEVSGVLRVCHMADHYQMAELGEQAKGFVDRHFAAAVNTRTGGAVEPHRAASIRGDQRVPRTGAVGRGV